MKKILENKPVVYIMISVILALIFAGGVYWFATHGTAKNPSNLYAKEISLDSVPDSIRTEMENTLETAGAYFYKETDESQEVYALLTAGNVVGVNMEVDPVEEDGGIYFSVDFQDTGDVEETLLYKVYQTNASAVAGDDLRLKAPYEQEGDTGMNIGLLQKMDSGAGYYIIPFLDADSANRVFVPADDSLSDLENGIYLYTYQLTSDGVLLTSAEKRSDYDLVCVVTGYDDEPQPAATVQIHDQINVKVSIADETIQKTLCENDFEEYQLNCEATLTYQDGEVKVSKLTVKSYIPLSEMSGISDTNGN